MALELGAEIEELLVGQRAVQHLVASDQAGRAGGRTGAEAAGKRDIGVDLNRQLARLGGVGGGERCADAGADHASHGGVGRIADTPSGWRPSSTVSRA